MDISQQEINAKYCLNIVPKSMLNNNWYFSTFFLQKILPLFTPIADASQMTPMSSTHLNCLEAFLYIYCNPSCPLAMQLSSLGKEFVSLWIRFSVGLIMPGWLLLKCARCKIMGIKSHKNYVQGKKVSPGVFTCISFILNLENDVFW